MIHRILDYIVRLIYKINTSRLRSDTIIIGEHSCVNPTSCVSTKWGGVIKIGSYCRIGNFPQTYFIARFFKNRICTVNTEACIEIGDGSELNGANICCKKFISIGRNAQIASGTTITDYNGHVVKTHDRKKCIDTPKPITIGNNVWIGMNAIILKGTSIGDNSVVSAGSVCKGEFPSNSIISGNPAVVISRFEIEN